MPDPAPITRDNMIELDIYCVRCGYNLRGSVLNGNCPECGQSVRDTVPAPHDEPYEIFTLIPEQRQKRLRFAKWGYSISIGISAISVVMYLVGAWVVPSYAPRGLIAAAMMTMVGGLCHFASTQSRAYIDYVLVVTEHTMTLTRPYVTTIVLKQNEIKQYLMRRQWLVVRGPAVDGIAVPRAVAKFSRIEATLVRWNISRQRSTTTIIKEYSWIASLVAWILAMEFVDNLMIYIAVMLSAWSMMGYGIRQLLLGWNPVFTRRAMCVFSCVLLPPILLALAVFTVAKLVDLW